MRVTRTYEINDEELHALTLQEWTENLDNDELFQNYNEVAVALTYDCDLSGNDDVVTVVSIDLEEADNVEV